MRIVKKLHFVGSFEHQGQHKKFSGDIVADSAKPSMKITGRLPTGEKFSGLTPSIDSSTSYQQYPKGHVIGEYGTGLDVSLTLDPQGKGSVDFYMNEKDHAQCTSENAYKTHISMPIRRQYKCGNAIITGSVIYDKTGREIEKTGDLPASAFTAANNKPQTPRQQFKNIPSYLIQ